MTVIVKKEGSDAGPALLCAKALRSLGWSDEDIDKILAGPRQSSIHDIAGRPVDAWSVDTVGAVTVPELGGNPASLAPAEDEVLIADVGIGQKDIADAVWASVAAGDPTPLASIALQLKRLPGPLQAYLLACSREVKRYYKDLVEWKRDFDRIQREGDTQRDKDRKEGLATAGTTAGILAAVATAAAVANAVPVVGQVVSAVLALGLAISTAITEAYALPVRNAEDQVRPGYEGTRVFWGFPVEAPENPYEDPYLNQFERTRDPIELETFMGVRDLKPPEDERTREGNEMGGDRAQDGGCFGKAGSVARTYELFGKHKGRVVPLAEILRIRAGVKELTRGAQVLITSQESQGFGLGGQPGLWEDLYPGINPATYGLDLDKPVLASDGSRGWVVDAHYLAMIFGADWRRVVYGN